MPYIGNSPGTGTRNRYIYTATASQTTFSGADDNGKTLAYSDGDYVDVFLNGICLVPVDDYTATSKTSIVLTVGAAADDILEVVAYDIATIADTVSKANGGQFDGDVTVNASFTVDNGDIKLDGNYPTGTSNVALGDAALDDASLTGGYNTAIGPSALSSATSGNSNIAVGYQALRDTTTAAGNVSVGVNAMRDATSGGSNIAVGQDALRSNTTASNNTAVGYQAGYTTSTGDSNTFVGQQAGYSTVGNRNTFVGRFAGNASNLAATQQNTFVGCFSGRYVTSGAKNTILGAYDGNQGGLDIRTSSNNIVLSDGDGNPRGYYHGGLSSPLWIFETPTTGQNSMHVKNSSTGSPYGIASQFTGASPNNTSQYFYVAYDAPASSTKFVVYANGNVANVNNSYGAISDVKLKENIVDSGSQWDDIKALRVRKYSMKSDNLDAPNQLGVIAQELEDAGMNGLVFETPDQDFDTKEDLGTVTKQVNYSILYMKAVKALQEAMDRIETLEAKVTALENA